MHTAKMNERLSNYQYVVAVLSLISTVNAQSCQELSTYSASAAELRLTGNFSQVIKCKGVSSFFLVPYLWSPIKLSLDCGKLQTYQVYIASTPDELLERYRKREQAWCSLSSLFGSGCQVQLSPFTTSYIGIRKFMHTGSPCVFHGEAEVSGWMLLSFLAGVLVYPLAGPLSESMALRVTSGGLLFAVGSVLILIYVLARQMPGRRSMAATAMLLGSSSWGILRWLTGYWLPSGYALLHNRLLLAYLVVMGLLGAAVTYMYGGVENTRLNTVLRVGLQLFGFLLIYMGTWTCSSLYAAVVAVALLHRCTTAINTALKRRSAQNALNKAQTASQTRAGAEFEEKLPMTPTGPSWAQQYAQSPLGDVPLADGDVVARVSPLPQTPLSLQFMSGSASVMALDQFDDCVPTGLIRGPGNKMIVIGGEEYEELVGQGYEPDVRLGRMRPPSATPGAGSSFGSPPWSETSVHHRRRNRDL